MSRRVAIDAPAGPPAIPGIEAALAAVWNRTRGVLAERVETIELATGELTKTPADAMRVEAGRIEAHRLAGVLGTFGLSHGTDLARDIEEHLACPDARAEADRLAGLAVELRKIVESGQGATASSP